MNQTQINLIGTTLAHTNFRSIKNKVEKAAKLYIHLRSIKKPLSLDLILMYFNKKSREIMTKGKLYRAVQAVRNNREIGKVGKPFSLSIKEESFLENRVKELSTSSEPPTHNQVLRMANAMITQTNQQNFLNPNPYLKQRKQIKSREWSRNYVDRMELSEDTTKYIETARLEVSKAEIIEFFKTLENLFRKHNYKSALISVGDESIAVKEGDFDGIVIVASSQLGETRKKKLKKCDLVSLFAHVYGNGEHSEGFLILKRKTIQEDFFDDDVIPKLSYTFSKKGYMTKRVFNIWVKDCYLKELKKRRKRYGNGRALMILDGHGSRACYKSMKKLKKANVDVLILPGNATHILCTLDLINFGTYQNLMRNSVHPPEWTKLLQLIENCHYRSMTPFSIREGFRQSGIYPLCFQTIQDKLVYKKLPEKRIPRKTKRYSINNKVLTQSDVLAELKRFNRNTEENKMKD